MPIASSNNNKVYPIGKEDTYTGGQEGQLPPLSLSMGAGGARIVLNAELFPPLLSSEGAFSGIVDSLVQENFSGASPQTPKFALYY